MNPRPASHPTKPRSRSRVPGASITQPQKLIIILAGLLLITWIIVAVIFVMTTGPSIAQSIPTANQPASASSPTYPITQTVSKANPPLSSISISAACAQNNSGTEEGQVSGVDDQGFIEVTTSSKILHIGFAGIDLLPARQPDRQVVQTIRKMMFNQPVLLVRDVSTGEDSDLAYRYIFTPQTFMNNELVRQGLAVVNLNSADQSCAAVFQLSEQKARSQRLGMWEPTRVPTRTFVPFVTLDTSRQPACECSRRYECSDFRTHADAQDCYNACNDYTSRLDPDRNGIACEDLP
jgi:hypothetical protein